jgi:hypothetical protein
MVTNHSERGIHYAQTGFPHVTHLSRQPGTKPRPAQTALSESNLQPRSARWHLLVAGLLTVCHRERPYPQTVPQFGRAFG